MTSVIRGDDNFDSGAGISFAPAFESVVSYSTSSSVSHGLGRLPYFYTVSIRCVTSYNGYTAGDEAVITSMVDGDGGRTYMTRVSATNIYVVRDTTNLINTTPNWVSPGSTSYWRFVFRAW